MSEEKEKEEESQEKIEFDPNAFSESKSESNENNSEKNEKEKELNENNSEEEEDNYDFDWNQKEEESELSDDDKAKKLSDEAEAKRKKEEEDSKLSDEEKKKLELENKEKEEFSGSLTDDHYSAFAEELGIKAKSLPDLKKSIQDLEAENKRLREGGPVTNDKIKTLNSYLGLNSEELLRKDLAAQGFKDEKLESAMDAYKDNGILDVEAEKIRNAINVSIKQEKDSITQNTIELDAKQKEDREKSVKALNSYIDNQTDMFGFKMAKDEDSLVKVKSDHKEYITSGSFLKEITSDEKSLVEAAWIWKNKEKIFSSLTGKGSNKAKKEILDDMKNPDTDASKRNTDLNDDDFNASKFNS